MYSLCSTDRACNYVNASVIVSADAIKEEGTIQMLQSMDAAKYGLTESLCSMADEQFSVDECAAVRQVSEIVDVLTQDVTQISKALVSTQAVLLILL